MTLLSNPVVAAIAAIVMWWFGTGIILYVVRLAPWTFRWSALGAAVMFAVSLLGLARSSADTSVTGAYLAFTWVIILWGTQEVGFLLGLLTGPRAEPCPDGCSGWQRVGYAIETILYHEIALIISAAAVFAVTWSGPNQVGTWTFVILWAMRLSAKLNLFLGVPILHDQFLPDHLRYLASYFTIKPINPLFPVAVTIATIIATALAIQAVAPNATEADAIGLTLMSALMTLAVAEHWFMLIPLPVELLWSWATQSRIRPPPLAVTAPAPTHDAEAAEACKPKPSARQQLEDRFRQAFIERHGRVEPMPMSRDVGNAPVADWRTR
jgi:putative photosynthetic complex assembly protein 2